MRDEAAPDLSRRTFRSRPPSCRCRASLIGKPVKASPAEVEANPARAVPSCAPKMAEKC